MSHAHLNRWLALGDREFRAIFTLLLLSVPAIVYSQTLPNSPSLSSVLPASVSEAERDVQAGRFSEAETTLRVYLQRNESSSKAQYLLAYVLMRQGKAKEALEEYTRAAALQKPSAEELRGVGQSYVQLGAYSDADKWLTLSLQMDPASADSWYNIGRLRYTQNRFAEAVQCYQKVLALSAQSVKAENNLGLALEGLTRDGEAEAAYRQALVWQDAGQAGSASEQPLLNLAILLLHSLHTAEARSLLLKTLIYMRNWVNWTCES